MIVLVPVNPMMIVEGGNNGEVLVDPNQEGRQQRGQGNQGGAGCQKTAESWKYWRLYQNFPKFYTPWVCAQNSNPKYLLRSPGLGSMTWKVDSAKERGVSRRPITRLLAARFTTNLGIKAKMNTMEIVHYKQGNWGDRKALYAEYCR